MKIHMSTSIEGLLRLRDSQLKSILRMNPKEARKELLERKERGEKLIPSDKCDNFCPLKGCLGHKEKN